MDMTMLPYDETDDGYIACGDFPWRIRFCYGGSTPCFDVLPDCLSVTLGNEDLWQATSTYSYKGEVLQLDRITPDQAGGFGIYCSYYGAYQYFQPTSGSAYIRKYESPTPDGGSYISNTKIILAVKWPNFGTCEVPEGVLNTDTIFDYTGNTGQRLNIFEQNSGTSACPIDFTVSKVDSEFMSDGPGTATIIPCEAGGGVPNPVFVTLGNESFYGAIANSTQEVPKTSDSPLTYSLEISGNPSFTITILYTTENILNLFSIHRILDGSGATANLSKTSGTDYDPIAFSASSFGPPASATVSE
jgi:hypothetical protein